MKIVHVMANGEVKESIEGTVIKSEQFYKLLNDIQKKKEKKNDSIY